MFYLSISYSDDLNATNAGRQSILHLIAEQGLTSYFDSLMEYRNKLDLDLVDSNGRSALILAITGSNERPDMERLHMIETLLEAGANVNLKDKFGKSAYDYVKRGSGRSNWRIRRILRKANAQR